MTLATTALQKKSWYGAIQAVYLFLVAGLLVGLCSVHVQAQELDQNYQRTAKRYDKYFSVGATFQSNNDLGVQFRYARVRDAAHATIYQYNVHSLRHPQEVNYVNEIPGASPYKFGKLNFVLVNSFSIGDQMVIAERNAQKQVRVNWNYMAGPNITFLKPVYLQIIQPQGDSQGRFSVERYDPDIHNNQQQNFYGTAAFTNGLNETTVEYGLQARSSLSAYWGDKDDHFYGLEVGGQLLAYPEKLEIMANDNNRAFFLNLFVGIKMGWQS